jgi:TetR/AcrR family fatty acid metabolism transcriptional regulator
MGSNRDLAIVFQVELRSSMKFMEQFSETRVSDYLDLIRSIIRDGQRRGFFRASLDANVASKVFFGALDEMVTNWVLSRKEYDLRSTAKTVMDLFFNGVSA